MKLFTVRQTLGIPFFRNYQAFVSPKYVQLLLKKYWRKCMPHEL